MTLQPFPYFLFRTEEVVDPSTPSQKDSGRRGIEFCHSSVFKDQTDALAAILRSVFNRNSLVVPFRVDQRDEVQRSIGVKLF